MTQRLRPFLLLLVLVPVLTLQPRVLKADGETSSAEIAAAETLKPTPVYLGDGVTITWDSAAGSYRPPSAEQAAELAQRLRQMMAVSPAEGQRLAASTEAAKVETLANGIKRLRLSADQLRLSVIRVDAEGNLAPYCIDGPAKGRQILSSPLPEVGPQEEK